MPQNGVSHQSKVPKVGCGHIRTTEPTLLADAWAQTCTCFLYQYYLLQGADVRTADKTASALAFTSLLFLLPQLKTRML